MHQALRQIYIREHSQVLSLVLLPILISFTIKFLHSICHTLAHQLSRFLVTHDNFLLCDHSPPLQSVLLSCLVPAAGTLSLCHVQAGQRAWAARNCVGRVHSQSCSVLPLSHVGDDRQKYTTSRIHSCSRPAPEHASCVFDARDNTMDVTVLSLPSTENKKLAETSSHSSSCAF